MTLLEDRAKCTQGASGFHVTDHYNDHEESSIVCEGDCGIYLGQFWIFVSSYFYQLLFL